MKSETTSSYKYVRPMEGQIEDRWWSNLSDQTRATVLAYTNAGLRIRCDRWNQTHPPDRQFPR